MRRALLLAAVLVLAGCSAPAAPGADTPDTAAPAANGTAAPETTAAPTTGSPDDGSSTAAGTPRPDPSEDRLGWEGGYWYDESLSIDASDGLNESELTAVKYRTMARLERLRGLEFREDVTVEIISRAEYRERSGFGGGTVDPWRESFYEAGFLVGEDQTVPAAVADLYGASVGGYYSDGRIVIVSDDPDALRIRRSTFAHELVHALQDQHGLLRAAYARGYDAGSAATAVTEGEANYLADRYGERCAGNWSCVPSFDSGQAAPQERDINVALFATIWLPYSEGPSLIEARRAAGGWDAVAALYERPPASTEQVIHPERYGTDPPTEVAVADRSGAEWEPIGSRAGDGATLGEAALFAGLWANGPIPEDHVGTDERRWNYSHPITDGWAGDLVVPYTDGEATGYVFKSEWASAAEAREFRAGYVAMLREQGAREVRPGVYRIPDDRRFGDAFRVTVRGSTVVVVNAPTVGDLDAVRAPE